MLSKRWLGAVIISVLIIMPAHYFSLQAQIRTARATMKEIKYCQTQSQPIYLREVIEQGIAVGCRHVLN